MFQVQYLVDTQNVCLLYHENVIWNSVKRCNLQESQVSAGEESSRIPKDPSKCLKFFFCLEKNDGLIVNRIFRSGTLKRGQRDVQTPRHGGASSEELAAAVDKWEINRQRLDDVDGVQI